MDLGEFFEEIEEFTKMVKDEYKIMITFEVHDSKLYLNYKTKYQVFEYDNLIRNILVMSKEEFRSYLHTKLMSIFKKLVTGEG